MLAYPKLKERRGSPEACQVHQPLQVFHETSVIQVVARQDDLLKRYR